MLIIGDVLAVVFALVGVCVTAAAMMVGSALLFENHAGRAREICRAAPGRSFILGLLATVFFGVVSLTLLQVPVPLVKLAGTLIYLTLMALSAIGMSGVALLTAERISRADESVSRFAALLRASFLLSIACVFPLLGWFLAGPALFATSVGIGVQALLIRSRVAHAPSVQI